MLLTKAISCCRTIAKPQFLAPLTCVLDVNRSCAEEVKKLKFKKKPIRVTPRKPVSLGKSEKKVAKTTSNDSDIPPFVDVDPYHSKLVRLLTAVKTKRQRYTNMMVMLEGKRLIGEALAADMEPILILFSRKKLLKGLAFDDKHIEPESTIIHRLHYKHMKTWSSLTTCPGLIGIFRMPNLEDNQMIVDPLPVTLVCDNIRDPGNLGSVLRVAAALPVEKVILLNGCVDLWDPKVTRGSCGAMFHLSIMNNASWDDVKDHCSGHIILADHESESVLEGDDEEATIQAEDYYEDPEATFVGNDEGDEGDDTDDDENSDEKSYLRKLYNLPSKLYSNVNYLKDNSYVIIVGGETEGLSKESFQFASERNGIRVNIPLATTVNSLNAATALGIISFEIKRQIDSKS